MTYYHFEICGVLLCLRWWPDFSGTLAAERLSTRQRKGATEMQTFKPDLRKVTVTTTAGGLHTGKMSQTEIAIGLSTSLCGGAEFCTRIKRNHG